MVSLFRWYRISVPLEFSHVVSSTNYVNLGKKKNQIESMNKLILNFWVRSCCKNTRTHNFVMWWNEVRNRKSLDLYDRTVWIMYIYSCLLVWLSIQIFLPFRSFRLFHCDFREMILKSHWFEIDCSNQIELIGWGKKFPYLWL